MGSTNVRQVTPVPGRSVGNGRRGTDPCCPRKPVPSGGPWPQRLDKHEPADYVCEDCPSVRVGAVAPFVPCVAGELRIGPCERVSHHHRLQVDRQHRFDSGPALRPGDGRRLSTCLYTYHQRGTESGTVRARNALQGAEPRNAKPRFFRGLRAVARVYNRSSGRRRTRTAGFHRVRMAL